MRTTNNSFWYPSNAGISMISGIIFCLVISCQMKPPENSFAAQTERGKTHFQKHCTSCHGEDGTGLAMESFKVQPADLTKIKARRGVSKFPVKQIARMIDGRQLVEAHGPRDMPVWGKVFTESENLDDEQLKGKLGELIAYLMKIQEG